MSLCINPNCPQPNHPDNSKNRFCTSCGSLLEIGRYRVRRLLSHQSGLGKVYEAYDQDRPKVIAVTEENPNTNTLPQQACLGEQSFQYRTKQGLVLYCTVMEQTATTKLELKRLKQQQPRVQSPNTKQLAPSLPENFISQSQQRHSVPLPKLFAMMLVSFGLLGLAALAARASLGGAALVPAVAVNFTFYPPGYRQIPEKKGKVDYFAYQEGKDSQGRTAEFNIAVLSTKYKWLSGSNEQIKYKNQIINVDDLRAKLEQQGIQTIMENPTEIISVGTAACEGTPQFEERTAFERAKQIQRLVKKLFFQEGSSVKDYRILNLGQFRPQQCQSHRNETTYQRSLIIIGVRKKSEGVNIDEALRNRLKNKSFADFKLKDYSLATGDKFKTIPSNL
jgi:hypothetical protein